MKVIEYTIAYRLYSSTQQEEIFLDDFGRVGWELCSTIKIEDSIGYYFKRHRDPKNKII